jgi:ABC-type branched-subunit amino acid transport system substrate-binding protein
MPDTQTLSSTAPAGPRISRRLKRMAAVAVLVLLLAAGGLVWAFAQRPQPIVIALAFSLSGKAAGFGQEARTGIQLYLDHVNAAGGVNGRSVVVEGFDDKSDPAVARANVAAILKSPAVAVLGHPLNATSAAAGPGYQAGHIAALSGLASADEVNRNNPWYFLARSPNTAQGAFLAEYIHTVLLRHTSTFLRAPDIDLVTSDDPDGNTFRTGFVNGDGGKAPKTIPGAAWRRHRKVRHDRGRRFGAGTRTAPDRPRRGT